MVNITLLIQGNLSVHGEGSKMARGGDLEELGIKTNVTCIFYTVNHLCTHCAFR